jgi:autotransporter-associated beta strand protein
MTGGGLSVRADVCVGQAQGGSGTGTFTQSGGIHQIGVPGQGSQPNLKVGSAPGWSGYYVLTGSGQLINLVGCAIGWAGTGTFTQTGGTNTVDGLGLGQNPYFFYLGFHAGSSGSYMLSGSGQLDVNTPMYVGYSGAGSFTQSGGMNNLSGSSVLTLAYSAGSSGTYTLSGGTVVVPQVCGGAGTSVFNFNGGVLRAAPFVASGNFFSGLTNAYIQAGGANLDTNGENITITQPLLDGGGGGGLTKYGDGRLTLAGPNGYSGGTTIAGGVLNINADAALGNTSGPLVFAGNGSLQFGSAMTSNRAFTLNSGCNGTIDTQSYNATLGGQISGNGGLTKIGYGMLTLSGTSNHTGGTTLSQGTLAVTGALTGGGNIQIDAGTTLSGVGLIRGNITGQAGSTINATGNFVLGDSTSFTGFNHAGTLIVGNNAVTLNSKQFASLGVVTTLADGTLAAPNGISVGVGCALSGSGAVNAKIAAGFGSTIEATGSLALGNSSSPVGFVSDGELYTNGNTVTLSDSNQAVLGSLTELGAGNTSGTLNANHGFLVDHGKNLIGQGTVNSTNSLVNAAIINGSVQGIGTGLNLTGYIKGVGTFSGPITFSGTYSPGLSPASVNLEDMNLTSTSTLVMELGGLMAGSQYDVVNLSGTGSLAGTLDVELLGNFTPNAGDTFDVLNGNTTGRFDYLALPALGNGLSWNTSQLYTTGAISVVPEPSTLALLGAGAVWAAVCAWRARRRRLDCGCVPVSTGKSGDTVPVLCKTRNMPPGFAQPKYDALHRRDPCSAVTRKVAIYCDPLRRL